MISVIIPALNEQETIAHVVQFCFKEPLVSQVIVVDDKSTDDTVARAAKAGAKTVISEVRGKGTSMRDGVAAASNNIIVFLDADIHPYPEKTIKKLVQPIIDNECDFTKGAFARNAGRVTELVAKPLLKIFFPELSSFQQPLSGMIAGKRSLLGKVSFFSDYGVDIGILIDMFLMQARVKEVPIGYIENKSKPWMALGKMSGEVSKAIIRKAALRQDNFVNLEQLGTVNVITGGMESVLQQEIKELKKMVIFDMDNTLLKGRFIDTCAEKFLFDEELNRLRQSEKDPFVLTKKIARILKGLSMGDLLKVASSIPLVNDAEEVVAELKAKGNIVGIVSDSYQLIVDLVRTRIGADFAIANRLEYFEGKATGEVIIPSWFYNNLESKCNHTICKTNVLMYASHRYGIPLHNCIAVGDSGNDRCMIERSGMGVAFCTKNEQLKDIADLVIDHPSFKPLLAAADGPLKKFNEPDLNTTVLQ
ncbi:MAG: HAD-IB family phosphatase [Dinghuibacter sp.]|nr:HAD-IB family phosphatase [Dinghuibacter sp.]